MITSTSNVQIKEITALLKKSKEQSGKRMQFIGKICLTLGAICSIPIFLVLGYILYIYIG